MSDDVENDVPPPNKRGGFRPGAGRKHGTFKVGDEYIRGSRKPKANVRKLNEATAVINDAAAALGVTIDPIVEGMTPVEIQLLASRMYASAALSEVDPEERLRKLATAASLANRISDFFDAKMPSHQVVIVGQGLASYTTAELREMMATQLLEAPVIEGKAEPPAES